MKSFMALVTGMSNQLKQDPLTLEQKQAETVGEMFADEFVAEARAGKLPDGALAIAISTLSNPDIFVLAGFLRRITQVLEDK
jgi:hypothetical protein